MKRGAGLRKPESPVPDRNIIDKGSEEREAKTAIIAFDPVPKPLEKDEDNAKSDKIVNITSTSKKTRRPWTQYRRIVFILGCLLGILLAWAARSPDIQLEGLLESMDVADFFDDLKAVLPSTLPIGLVREAREIQEHSRQAALTGAFSVGEQMAREGMEAYYPVVMVSHLS